MAVGTSLGSQQEGTATHSLAAVYTTPPKQSSPGRVCVVVKGSVPSLLQTSRGDL